MEQVTPVIEAVAVTDYYVTHTYEEVLRQKAAGRLPAAKLIFPNVELRLDVATAKGAFVNLHLFVSPADPQHLDELRRLLSRLRFNVMQDHFDCTHADLIRLGKKADPAITDDQAAPPMVHRVCARPPTSFSPAVLRSGSFGSAKGILVPMRFERDTEG